MTIDELLKLNGGEIRIDDNYRITKQSDCHLVIQSKHSDEWNYQYSLAPNVANAIIQATEKAIAERGPGPVAEVIPG